MIQASKHVQLILMCTTVKIAKAFIFFPNVTNTHTHRGPEVGVAVNSVLVKGFHVINMHLNVS